MMCVCAFLRRPPIVLTQSLKLASIYRMDTQMIDQEPHRRLFCLVSEINGHILTSKIFFNATASSSFAALIHAFRPSFSQPILLQLHLRLA